MTIGSARVSGGKLSSFVTTTVGNSGGTLVPFLGDVLAFYVGNYDEFLTAPLLPSGRLGAQKRVPEDFLAKAQERIPKACSAHAADGTRVGNRTFWAVSGASQKKGCQAEVFGGDPFFLACCDQSGAASLPIPHINPYMRGAIGVDISSDAKGRIWLLWLDNTCCTGAYRGTARLVEIDPATMALRTPPYAVPTGRVDNLKLACASVCRAVVQTAGGNLASWAPRRPLADDRRPQGRRRQLGGGRAAARGRVLPRRPARGCLPSRRRDEGRQRGHARRYSRRCSRQECEGRELDRDHHLAADDLAAAQREAAVSRVHRPCPVRDVRPGRPCCSGRVPDRPREQPQLPRGAQHTSASGWLAE